MLQVQDVGGYYGSFNVCQGAVQAASRKAVKESSFCSSQTNVDASLLKLLNGANLVLCGVKPKPGKTRAN